MEEMPQVLTDCTLVKNSARVFAESCECAAILGAKMVPRFFYGGSGIYFGFMIDKRVVIFDYTNGIVVFVVRRDNFFEMGKVPNLLQACSTGELNSAFIPFTSGIKTEPLLGEEEERIEGALRAVPRTISVL